MKTPEEKKSFQEVMHIEGVGTISQVGKLDLEKLIRNLLKNKYIIS